MKKTFLLATILFISVISTACINNFAVQELNNKAKAYMDKGDYSSAIERLKSSVDLDDSLFETHYNLAVAYTQAEDYENAMHSYNKAIKLNPDFADSYYSLAVCEENLAKDIISFRLSVDEDGNIQKPEVSAENSDEVSTEEKKLSEPAIKKITELLNNAKEDYGLYLDKSQNPSEEEAIKNKTEELNSLLEKHAK